MARPANAAEYREKARNCRSLAESAEERIATQLSFLAEEYESAASMLEQRDQAMID